MNIQSISIRRTALTLVIIFIALLPITSHATVGGPTYIYSFKYNPTNESVYFVKQSESGKGCPPELLKMALATGATDAVFSCDQGITLMTADINVGYTPVNTAINNIIKNFKDLTQIHLPKNNIAVDVNFVRSEKYPNDDFVAQPHFIAKVFQDNIMLAEVPIVGCALDQPFVFAGYAIPGFEKRIVLLLSTKGDCYEGGYINETLYTVGDIAHIDRTPVGDSWKIASPLVLSAATLAVFEKDIVGANADPTDSDGTVDTVPIPTTEEESSQDNSYPLIPLALATVIGMVIGFVISALIFRSRRNNSFTTT